MTHPKVHTLSNLTLIACVALAGCASKSTSSDDLEGVPEVATVEMRFTGDPTSEGAATAQDAIDAESMVADELDEVAVPTTTDISDLQKLRGAVKDVNDAIRDFLGPVAALVRNEAPSVRVGALKMWGPTTRGATQYRFFLRHASVHHWGWRLDARIADAKEAWTPVAAGEIEVGLVKRRGAGVMGFDLDALSTLDPTVLAHGRVLAGFRHTELGTTVGYALQDFTRDPAARPGVDALLRAVHLKDGFNRLRLAYRRNVEGTATPAEELVLARVRHQRGTGGRSDAVVLGGDVPSDQAWVISQCWDGELKSVMRIVRSCPFEGISAESCAIVSTQGDAANCPARLRLAELPPADPEAAMPDQDDPNTDVTPPEQMPEGDGDAWTDG